jgi:hypothetical protein
MWVPRSLEELRAGLAARVHEAGSVEFKRELPGSSKTSDIAVDVAAMAAEGGTVVYGLTEDKETGTFTEAPIPLKGAIERINNVVQSGVREVPDYDAFALETALGVGFLVLAIPPSPRAPHMVEVKGNWRFYGRGPGGNVPLTEAQVARLYERRANDQAAADRLLDSIIRSAPTRDGMHVYLLVAFEPVLGDQGIRERWLSGQDLHAQSRSAIEAAVRALAFTTRWEPSLLAAATGNFELVVDGFLLRAEGVRLSIEDGGTLRVDRSRHRAARTGWRQSAHPSRWSYRTMYGPGCAVGRGDVSDVGIPRSSGWRRVCARGGRRHLEQRAET